MDLSTTIIGLVIVLMCAVPFVVMYFNNKKKQHQMLQNLHTLATHNKCSVTFYEFCGDLVLGIDDSKKHVFFHKQSKDFSSTSFVDLSQTKECQIFKKHHSDGLKSSANPIQSVFLIFKRNNDVQHESSFELFNRQLDLQLSGELQFAEKWSKRINNLLNR